MTPVGGVPDFLVNGANGYLIARDPSDIAAKVDRLRADPAALAEMRARCVDIAAEYSWDRIAKRYLQLLNEHREAAPADLPDSSRCRTH
jgi:UDP-glucose:(heptosyl)LPS alpha-1,3-glucosyltransferase